MVTLRGGSDLERRLAEISENVKKAANVKIGFISGATYPDGTSVALVAAINEFGQTRVHPNQPPRPFFRRMIAEHSNEWPDQIARLLEHSDYDVAIALSGIGAVIQGQLQQSIRDFIDPGLAPATIAAKGHDKPLIDTGLMVRSATFVVDDGEGGSE